MVVRLLGNQSIEDEGKAADFVAATTKDLAFEGATVTTTGAPVLLQDVNDYLTGGMLTLGAIAVAIMVVILLVFFDVRWRLLPLGVILIGVAWAFGLAGYLGIPLTIVTIAGLPVMLGVGIDYAIQMHARVEEEVIVDSELHPIQETAKNLGPALLVVTFDAIFAFAALRFAKVPMIRDFGLLLAVGIAAICFCSIIAPLAFLGIREYKSPTKRSDFRRGPLGRLVLFLGALPSRIAPLLIVASLLIFVGGLAVEDELVLQTDPVEWVNQDTQVIRDLAVLDREVKSSSELGIFFRTEDVFSDENAQFIHQFANQQLDDYPETLLTASSIVTTVSFLMEVPGAGDVAPTGADVKATFDVAPEAIKLSTANLDQGAMNLVFRTGPGGLDARAEVVREIRDTVKPPEGISATPSGLAVVGVGLLDNLEANRILLTYLAILFVFLFLSVRLRSVVRALLSLVPVLIAVGAASLVAFALDLKLSPMTAVGGPLVIAACTEFTSLILLRFIEERRRGLPPKEAIDVTAARTGRAFIVSAMTAISGVAVIATSSLPLLRDFGLVVGMNVTVALLSALVVLPPMLVWADERHWVSRHLVPQAVLDASDERARAARAAATGHRTRLRERCRPGTMGSWTSRPSGWSTSRRGSTWPTSTPTPSCRWSSGCASGCSRRPTSPPRWCWPRPTPTADPRLAPCCCGGSTATAAPSSPATTAARARILPPTPTGRSCAAGSRCSVRCASGARWPRCLARRARPTSPPAPGAASWRPGPRTSRASWPTAPSSRPASPRPRCASPTATCPARPTGAAIGWCPRRSSSGRVGAAGCTTASATSSIQLSRPAGGSSGSARSPRRSATAVRLSSGPSTGQGAPGPRRSALLTRRSCRPGCLPRVTGGGNPRSGGCDQAADEVGGVGDRGVRRQVGPEGPVAADPRWQLDLHPAVPAPVHGVAAVHARAGPGGSASRSSTTV